eukprot:jgi/Psemu1/285512/fgenesh1_pg.91_\
MTTVIDETNDEIGTATNGTTTSAGDAVASAGAVPSLFLPQPRALSRSLPPESPTTATTAAMNPSRNEPPRNTATGKPKLPPNNSDLMNRLRNFLPQMQSANQELLSNPLASFDGTLLSSGQQQQQQIQQANHSIRLDADLKLDEDSDSDDDDGDDETRRSSPLIREVGADDSAPVAANESTASETSNQTTASSSEAATTPTIQLQFSLGAMSENPLMKLLVGDDDSDDDDDDSDSDSDGMEAARLQTVSNLLRQVPADNKESASSGAKPQSVIRLSGGEATATATSTAGTKSKSKSLITELS